MLKTIKNDIDEARMTSSPTHQEEAAKDVNVILERGRALPAGAAAYSEILGLHTRYTKVAEEEGGW